VDCQKDAYLLKHATNHENFCSFHPLQIERGISFFTVSSSFTILQWISFFPVMLPSWFGIYQTALPKTTKWASSKDVELWSEGNFFIKQNIDKKLLNLIIHIFRKLNCSSLKMINCQYQASSWAHCKPRQIQVLYTLFAFLPTGNNTTEKNI